VAFEFLACIVIVLSLALGFLLQLSKLHDFLIELLADIFIDVFIVLTECLERVQDFRFESEGDSA
jgi:ABC-type amino acid transport system permease subunit